MNNNQNQEENDMSYIAFHGSFNEVPPHEQDGEENFHAASRPQGSIERLGLQMYTNASLAQDMGDDDSIGPYGISPAFIHVYEAFVKPDAKVYSDPHANMDAYGSGYEDDEEQDEADTVPEYGTLTQPLQYRNQHEDAGQLSYVFPKHMVGRGINYVGRIPITVSQDAVPWTKDAEYEYGIKDVIWQMGYDPRDFN
jgi:hypothetical protein